MGGLGFVYDIIPETEQRNVAHVRYVTTSPHLHIPSSSSPPSSPTSMSADSPTPTRTSSLPLAPSQDELLLALSHIVFRREYRPHSPPSDSDDSSTKHLELLNLLSLLLVTRAEGDVAAVMFRVLGQNRIELHYAKNRPSDAKEREYIKKLFEIVRDADPTADMNGDITRWSILSLVIPACKRKMLSRLKKLRKRLDQIATAASSVEGFSDSPAMYFAINANACAVSSEEWLRDAIGRSVFPTTATLQRFLQGWFTSVFNKPPAIFKDWHAPSVHHTLRIAYYIGQTPNISDVLDSTLLGRVRKLGDFYAAALTVISSAALLPREQLCNLSIMPVQSTPPRTLQLPEDFVGTVNAWARHTGEAEVSPEDLRIAFPEMDTIKPTPEGTQSVTVSVHCECTLLLSMLGTPTIPAPVLLEIGVSKSSCFMCREFVHSVHMQYRHLTIVISSCHGKHVAGWSLPDSAPERLRNAMEKRVHDDMDDVLQRATRKRRSDSVPRAGLPSPGTVPAVSAESDVEIVKQDGGWVFSLEEDGTEGM